MWVKCKSVVCYFRLKEYEEKYGPTIDVNQNLQNIGI